MVVGFFCVCLVALAQQGEPLSVLGRHELACPVCEQVFTTVACVQSNTRGGVDRDLFARALGPQPEFYRISTCPGCGYSGYGDDFEAGTIIPPDVREKVLKAPRLRLPAGFTPQSDPRELDAADRYTLAITCYRWRGKSDEALGWLHLRASWIAREEGSSLPRDSRLQRVMEYIERWRPTMRAGDNQADIELRMAARVAEAITSGRFNRYQKPYVELALALILRRHGENSQAQTILDRLAGHEGFAPPVREGIERMRDSIVREREHQQEASALFERALLADQVASANRGPARYLLGELCRRLGRADEAKRWFDQALAEPSLPADLRGWAREQSRPWESEKTEVRSQKSEVGRQESAGGRQGRNR